MITVKPEGGDYYSLTEAVYKTFDTCEDIVVYPGTYDIKQEYRCFFKTTDINNETNLGHDFQYGIRIKNRTVTFLPGSFIECVWYFPTDFSAKFSPIYMGENAKIYGLNLYAEGTEYVIHDDVWRSDIPYVNEYHNCVVIGKNLFAENCIGGGATKFSRFIIDNCYFDNGVKDGVTVRYHNTDYEDGHSDIWINNSYFNGKIAFTYYGTSSVMHAYVNGCEAKAIEIKPETDDSCIKNVILSSWNNKLDGVIYK